MLAYALDERGYAELTPVQLSVLEPGASGRDLLVSARTGSGKTVAYGLAFAADLLGESEELATAAVPLALVIAPTRELALQVERELAWLYAGAGARILACVGGMDPRRERRELEAGAHIVVGTPGRLRDHLDRGQLQLSNLKVAVLDEADEMLDLGFREELEAILDAAQPSRRTLLFSATLPKPIIALASRYQRDAVRINVATDEHGHADIDYRAVRIAPSDVEHAVVNLLRFYEAGATLVFCATRESVRRLHANLIERGFSAVALSGELTQAERTHALQALRDRRVRVCVATDVAARGIDIPDLELVIHAELPNGAEALQHRSGRTGRAGRKGVSVILVPHPRQRRAEALFRTAHVEATWVAPPSADEIRARDQARLIERLRPSEDASEEDLAVARTLLAEAGPEQLVAALVRARRAELPAPEDLIDNAPHTLIRPAAARPGFEDSAWFRIDIGRQRNAEARWLLPLICRRGHVSRQEIGAIRVFDRETRFEIAHSAAERFLAATRDVGAEGGVIEPLTEPDRPPPRARRPSPKPDHRRTLNAEAAAARVASPQTSKHQTSKPQTSQRQAAKLGAAPRPHAGKSAKPKFKPTGKMRPRA